MQLDLALRAPDSYVRDDESDDALFYSRSRPVHHLDKRARETIQRIFGALLIEDRPAVLDLMAGGDSHLPPDVRPRELVGLGLDEGELERNPRLDRRVVHDLNRSPVLPFPDASFDAVLNTVSVDYLVRPLEVFAEVSRVLVPGGLCVVVFSNRMFPQKAVQIWKESDELTRAYLIEQFLAAAPAFGPPRRFSSRGKPRPQDDRYAGLGLPSDPITAVWVEKAGAPVGRAPRPDVPPEPAPGPHPEVVAERKRRVHETLACPYCEVALERFEIPPNPFCEWPDEFVYVCFNNDCPYLIAGWDAMAEQGNVGLSYRLMYNPTLRKCLPTPVPNGATARTAVITPRG